jgi:hypothetical protein
MSVRPPFAEAFSFVCQMQGSWVSIKGADVPAAAEDQSLLYAPTHNQK